MFLKSSLPNICKLNIFLISVGFTLPFAVSMRESIINNQLKNPQGLQVRGRSRPKILRWNPKP